MTDLAPLHSPDAERSVLGGLLFRPALISVLPIQGDDFFSMRHQVIWQAMASLDAAGQAVDPVTVAEELRRLGKAGAFNAGLAEDSTAGPLAYLTELALACPDPGSTERYAKILHRYAQKRATVSAVSDLLHTLRTSEVAEDEDVRLATIAKLQKMDSGFDDPGRYLGDLMVEETKAVQAAIDSDSPELSSFMPTGIAGLDSKIGGTPLGCTTLILGETGAGKSTVAMQLARAAVTIANDEPLVISYEDAFRSFARRGLAQDSGVPTQRIGSRRFRDGEAKKVIVDGLRNVGMRRERIYRFRSKSMAEVCQLVRRVRAQGPRRGGRTVGRLVIIDYFQAVRTPRGMDKVEGYAENARLLEDLADEQDISVVIMSQCNDDARKRDGVIELNDVRGGRDVANGCKLALGLYRPHLYDTKVDPTKGKLLVVKNNGGESGRNVAVDIKLELSIHSIRDAEDV